MTRRIRVGVVRGGPSAEYDVSLNTGAAVLSALRDKFEDRYDPVDVFIDKAGRWHIFGKEIRPEDSHHYFDIAWNALHGNYGEDGKIQSFFETHGMPFTGSGSLSSAVGMNKILTKKVLKDHNIKSPYWKEASADDIRNDIDNAVEDLFSTFILPAIIKPAQSGSSVGVSIVRTKDDIGPALWEAIKHGDQILVEEFIPGVEATCGVIEGFRGEELYALPPIEIRPRNSFFDYNAKYAGESEEIVPGRFSREKKSAIEDLARSVHRLLRLKHYSRTDFIIHPRRGIYVLETNTLPGLTKESLVPKALRAVGTDIHELIDHVIRLELGV
ncbi:MAG: D-alanine--D-alanine ligase [Candidatus Taylorbacteria bacterium]|nr:D-alanine--D-alanine ligase [Candidatus Taylorbacteria bacterium]